MKPVQNPLEEPGFPPGSYGNRPGRSAAQALTVTVTRQRCGRYGGVLACDIQGLFDQIDHTWRRHAVRWHTDTPWVRLYTERWLTAPFPHADGTRIARAGKATRRGGEPVLANLFRHDAFDLWMVQPHPDEPFARSAADAGVHGRNKVAAIAAQPVATLLTALRVTKRPSRRHTSYDHPCFEAPCKALKDRRPFQIASPVSRGRARGWGRIARVPQGSPAQRARVAAPGAGAPRRRTRRPAAAGYARHPQVGAGPPQPPALADRVAITSPEDPPYSGRVNCLC